ncbi:beta strand repeat-containing protein [Pararobbsia silviterrae]|uniref:beta strand repeat-containing protein n=1 Tax=Pararobbsia silviterrae TaxID=1792498 RepID=UPI0011C413D1|nr:autotransporter-associated beta strand repeat-containing protein [Pararobbsia silviterrae]
MKEFMGFVKSGKRIRSDAITAAIYIAFGVSAGLAADDARATTCTTTGTVVNCTGADNPLSPSYTNATSGITVNTDSTTSFGVQLAVGGTAISLTGSNVTLNNSGVIDPDLLGTLSMLANGTVIGNSSASTINVTNSGTMNGTAQSESANLPSLTGLALAVQNGAGGVSTIVNNGTMSSTAIAGATVATADRVSVAVYGGGTVNFTNNGTINGRIGLQASSTGNTFTNAGSIVGSVSMGASSTNKFYALTGSSVSAGTGASEGVLGVTGLSLSFAQAGIVDGGAGGNNTLYLAQASGGPATGQISIANYIDFQTVSITSGTWTINGPSGALAATISSGATALIDSATGLGMGTVTSTGGTLQSLTAGLSVANLFSLGVGGLAVSGANDLTLSGAIIGVGSIFVFGPTVTLSGVDTYTGGTTIEEGTLAIGAGGSLAATGAVSLADSGAIFDISAATTPQTIGALSGVGGAAINLGANTLTFGDATNQTLGSTISGTGALVKDGTGVETLTGANTYTGGTSIDAGKLAIGAGGSLAATGAVNLADSGATFDISAAGATQTIGALSGVAGTTVALGANTLSFGDATNQTLASTISGTGGIDKDGAGVETLTGANTYTGGTTINAGKLAIGAGGSLAATGAVNLAASGASFDISAASAAQTIGALSGVAGSAVALGANTLTFGGTANQTLASMISGTGALVKDGTGIETLTSTNTYSGGTTLNAGGIVINNGSALGTGAVTVNNTVTLDSAAAVTLTNNFTLNGSVTVLGSNALTLNGVLTGAGSLTKDGAATLTLNGTNTYTGGTTIDAGTLALGANASLAATGIVYVATGATFDLSAGGGQQVFGTLEGGGTVDLGSNLLTLGSTLDATYTGVMGGTGGILKVGTGTETMAGANTYTGGTFISAGTIAIGASGSLAATGAVDLESAGSGFDISAAATLQTIGGLSGVAGSKVTLGANSLSFGDAGSEVLGSTISGTGGLIKQGSGTETLTGVSTFTGTTLINAGTLALSGSGSLSASSDVMLANAGTALDVSGTTSMASIGALSGVAGSSVSLGAAGLTLGSANDATFAGAISGGGGIVKEGTGTETLTSANTFTGGVVIQGGTFALGAGGSLAATGTVNLAASGTIFDVSAAGNQTIGGLSGVSGSMVNLGGTTLTVGANSTVFAGALSGTGTLLKQGTGTTILDGNNASFAGTTEVSAGLLEVGDINTPGAVLGGNVTVDAAGTLRGHGTVQGDVADNGTVAPGGTIGTLTIGGNYTQASAATLSIEVSPTAASQLNVVGSAALNGVLAIVYDPGTYTAKSYTLVSAGSLSGVFSQVTSTGTANLAGLTSAVSYSLNGVALTLSGVSSSVVVAPVDTSIFAALGTSALLGAQSQNAAVLDRLGGASTATPGAAAGWITATGSQTTVGGTNGAPGFQADRYGFLAGLDQKVGDYTVGVAAGYDHTAIDEQDSGDSGTTDTLRAALYGARAFGPVNVAATLGVGLDFLSQQRGFASQGTAEGDHIGQEINAGAQASMPMALGSVTVTPRVGLRYAYFHANGFGESGAGGEDLSVGTDNAHSLQPYVDLTLDKAFGDALKPVNVEWRVGYARELLDANRALSVASQDGTLFTAPGTSLPRGYLTTGFSVGTELKRNLTISLNGDALINTTHVSAEQGSVRMGYAF